MRTRVCVARRCVATLAGVQAVFFFFFSPIVSFPFHTFHFVFGGSASVEGERAAG